MPTPATTSVARGPRGRPSARTNATSHPAGEMRPRRPDDRPAAAPTPPRRPLPTPTPSQALEPMRGSAGGIGSCARARMESRRSEDSLGYILNPETSRQSYRRLPRASRSRDRGERKPSGCIVIRIRSRRGGSRADSPTRQGGWKREAGDAAAWPDDGVVELSGNSLSPHPSSQSELISARFQDSNGPKKTPSRRERSQTASRHPSASRIARSIAPWTRGMPSIVDVPAGCDPCRTRQP